MISETGKKIPSNAPRAFTLIELVLVLMIIAVVVGVTAPSLGRFVTSRKTADAAAEIAALARHARNSAIADGRTYRLALDEHSGEFWLEVQDGGSFTTTGTKLGHHIALPAGTSAKWQDATWSADQQVPGASPGSIASGNSTVGSLDSQAPNAVPGGLPGNSNRSAAVTGVRFYSDGSSDGQSLALTGSLNEHIDVGAPSTCEPWRVVKDSTP